MAESVTDIRIEALEQYVDQLRAERDSLRNQRDQAEREYADAIKVIAELADASDLLEARVEALRRAASDVENELRFRATTTNDIGQCEPPYTAHSLLSMADELSAALAAARPAQGDDARD